MNNETTAPTPNEPKPGLITRLLNTLDQKLKDKAQQQTEKGSCCGGDKPGGKCC